MTEEIRPAPAGGAHPDLATHDALGLATQAELDALATVAAAADAVHPADTTDAHTAAAIDFDDTGLGITAANAQEMGEQLDAAITAGGIPGTIVDAKGDLIVATAADTVARLAALANGASLITASGESTGLKWRLNNDAASAAPTVNDDSGDGYSIGSRWLDTTAGKEYVCLDATAAAASWAETTGGGAAAALQSAKYVRASANYSTTSTSFVDVDATNMALTITTGARRVMVGLVGTCAGSNLGNTLFFDVDMDGARLSGASFGLFQTRTPVAGYRQNASFTYLTDVLTAGSHTFKLQWFINANTAVLYGTAAGDGVATFWVQEVY